MFFLKAALVFFVIGLAMSSSRRTGQARDSQHYTLTPPNGGWPSTEKLECILGRMLCLWSGFPRNFTWFCSNLEMLWENCTEELSENKCENATQFANDRFLHHMSRCPGRNYECPVAKINCERKATQADNLAWICNNVETLREGCLEELSKSKCINSEQWVNSLFLTKIKPQCRAFSRQCLLARLTCDKKIGNHNLTWICNNLETLREYCTKILSEVKCENWEQWVDDQISGMEELCPLKEQLAPIFGCLISRAVIIFQKAMDCTKKNSLESSARCNFQASRDCCPRACELPTLLPKRYGFPEAFEVCKSPASSCDEPESRR